MCLMKDVKNAVWAYNRLCNSDRKGQGRHPEEVLFKPKRVGIRQVNWGKLCPAEEGACRPREQGKWGEWEREGTHMVLPMVR